MNLTKETIQKTINIFAFVFFILYFIFKINYLLYLAFFFVVLNLIETKISEIIVKHWLKFALFLGNINTKILLFLIFYLLLTPLAIFYRIFNKKQVEHFKKKKKDTYFYDIDLTYTKDDFEKMW